MTSLLRPDASEKAKNKALIEADNNRRWMEAIIDNLVDGIITFGEQGIIEMINPAGAYIFGYERQELVGKRVNLLLPNLEDDADDKTLAEFLDHVSNLGDEIEGQRKDGSRFPMYFAVSTIHLDNRRLYSAIIQDFTERKFLESQLWDKQRLNLELDKERELRNLKNHFISMMSHDLKTPLAAIRLANSMLRQYGDRATPEEKRESYDAIDQQVEYLTELVNDVMTISRTDFTGAELSREVVDLETYCRDVIEEIQLGYRMQCCLDFIGTDQRVEVWIDKKLMRRSLTNLLTNAIKYSPPNSPVMLEVAYTATEALIYIRDQGIGIPEADLKRLFEPFQRASNVGNITGTGLGLAITKQAIDLHGGTITVESKLNEGTTFTIRLPLKV
ncbi:MAG: PAS domain-containing sensor histidine kinase [Anaerolineae bacterium]|nr:PAS domain-containing sensor histidine kinase [Anaerolineae bacterium]